MSKQYTDRQIREGIESFIDQSSLNNVLEVIAGICQDRAEQFKVDYNDRVTARMWAVSGRAILRTSEKPTIRNLWSF